LVLWGKRALCGYGQRANRDRVFAQPGESHAGPGLKGIHHVPAQVTGNRRTPWFSKERDAAPEHNDLRMTEMNHMGKRQRELLCCLVKNAQR
jgi:hypothetical protein